MRPTSTGRFNDSGAVLADLIGVPDFESRVASLARSNLVQQGGELANLLRHDDAFRSVRREHLVEAGQRVRLKGNITALLRLLETGLEDAGFSFYVISAARTRCARSSNRTASRSTTGARGQPTA